MILLGSQALNFYIPINRKMHDWDFLVSQEGWDKFFIVFHSFLVKSLPSQKTAIFDIKGQIVEIHLPVDPTDFLLLENKNHINLDNAFGDFKLPSLQILFDIKKATSLYIDEPKHKHDLDLIKNSMFYKLLNNDTDFFKLRAKETEERVYKQNKVKYDFFHKYHIPEYIMHDRLHDMIAELIDITIPTYKRITVAETDISEELFNKLTHEQKVSLLAEEVLVLNLERWFIPQMIENGINYKLVSYFYNNNEAMPTYSILKHVCLTGLKGEAEYITKFAKDNFFEIELKWIQYKEMIKSKKDFPDWFFEELYNLRTKYKNNEKIGLHHND